jgi:CRISPR-associated protein Csb2
MRSYLCLSVHFLDPAFHGRSDGAAPEWPPSPLRVFQALVAASAARWGQRHLLDYARPALRWLEAEPPPEIVATPSVTGAAYRLSVPNNAMDLVGRAWSRGNTAGTGDANAATHRTMKPVRPTWLLNGDAVHYLWELPDPLTDDVRGHVATLTAAAGSVVVLGWGVDLVAGHGQVLSADDARRLPGERWRPAADRAAGGLRVPTPGTLDALVGRHEAFLHRLDGGAFTPVPALTAFAVVGYRRATDPPGRPFAAFELWQPADRLADLPPGKSKFRPFDPLQAAVTVAPMVRHAAAAAARAAGWAEQRINTFIHGHTPDGGDRARGEEADRRFAFVPLPSITPGKVESVRRVLVVGPPGATAEVDWARRALSGRELIEERTRRPVALLAVISANDPHLRKNYAGTGAVWSTVTPLVLPGYDDSKGVWHKLKAVRDLEARKRLLLHLDERTEALLRKAFEQAGLPRELVSGANLEWRRSGFRPGVDLADRYQLPHAAENRPSYQVRVRFPVPVPGPLVVGAGRYRGLGLFAAEAPGRSM